MLRAANVFSVVKETCDEDPDFLFASAARIFLIEHHQYSNGLIFRFRPFHLWLTSDAAEAFQLIFPFYHFF